ncbi:MAG TPA: nuclear transport factor 2 family protein [Candidatus Polarisedimenticolia bacterium]|nr:nuclear transport factor 2 family protein [Candidatus Polarisedimenticolia bacterium]
MPNVRTASRAATLLRGVAIASAVLAAAGPAARSIVDKEGAREKAVAEIKDFEARFNKAYETNDLRGYFDFYTSDMTQFYQKGRLDLPDYKRLWEKEVSDGGGMEEVKIADMTIQVGPSLDAAVAAYRIFTRQRHPGGAPTDTWNQETDVLFKRAGRWKVAHVHYSDAPKTN